MASDHSSNNKPSFNQVKPTTTTSLDVNQEPDGPDYSKRAQWLRAAILGANDGLLSVASLMIGVGAVRPDPGTMALTGLAGLFGGACSMALGELVSVWAQRDAELAQLLRDHEAQPGPPGILEDQKRALPSPLSAAAASAAAFAAGGGVPLLAAVFIKPYRARLAMVLATVSLALFAFGWLGAFLGKAPVLRSSLRVLIGGWVAMGVTFGLTKLVGLTGI
ncbi:vacuolar iron transporter homolog 2 [Beta vulgaris subsp. vulgaris]|uniref:vacuolar iron transporter homolog 2 n=1 Tax=Beta vulgaris subsp. vulgaris TaxID=3555 RepID=UPI0020372E0C|nr:vacuolar iron transporter homolog 2 [Beta vulgaris subsp. vulgaris]